MGQKLVNDYFSLLWRASLFNFLKNDSFPPSRRRSMKCFEFDFIWIGHVEFYDICIAIYRTLPISYVVVVSSSTIQFPKYFKKSIFRYPFRIGGNISIMLRTFELKLVSTFLWWEWFDIKIQVVLVSITKPFWNVERVTSLSRLPITKVR